MKSMRLALTIVGSAGAGSGRAGSGIGRLSLDVLSDREAPRCGTMPRNGSRGRRR